MYIDCINDSGPMANMLDCNIVAISASDVGRYFLD